MKRISTRARSTRKGIISAFIASIMLLYCSSVWAEEWIATAYCPCVSCCGKTDGITASGKKAVEGRTVAVNWLKLGQKVAVNGRTYVVEDRGAKSIFGSKQRHLRRIDIYFAHHKDALNFGRQKVNVEVL